LKAYVFVVQLTSTTTTTVSLRHLVIYNVSVAAGGRAMRKGTVGLSAVLDEIVHK